MARPRLLDHAADNLGRMMPPRLSIDANRFTLIDSTGNEKPIQQLYLDVCFIDLNPKVSKMYWGKEYNSQDAGGDIPVCWSDNGLAPSAQAATPQNPVCMTCPHNVIGSAVSKFSGAKIKACVDMKKLAFIVPGDEQNLIFLMTVKPGSFKNWSTYVNFLKAQKFTDGSSPDLSDVVTRLEFESQGVLKFTPISGVPGNQVLIAQREEAWARNVSGDIVGQNDVPYAAQLAGPPPQAQISPPPPPAAAPAPAPVSVPPPAAFAAPQQPAPIAPFMPGAPAAEPPKKRGRKAGATAATGFQAPLQDGTPSLRGADPQPQPAPHQGPQPGQAAAPLDIPPFLRRDQPPAPPPPAPSFGMASPAAPDAALQAAIDKAFALPT